MSNYYPAGLTDNTPGTPWSEPVVSEKEFDIICSQSLSKPTTVCTNDYIPGESGVDYDSDDEGGYCASPWQDLDDTSDTDWNHAYSQSGHHTPLELISLFKEFLNKNMPDPIVDIWQYKKYQNLIKECEGWTDDETTFIET